MEQTTYKKLAQLIRDTYYKGLPSDDANYSVRYFAELIAMEVAEMATMNAFENSNQGETTFSNDQFITTYPNISVVTDSALNQRYCVLPATPAALPNNQEINRVWAVGSSRREIMPMKNKDKGIQDLLSPIKSFIFYYIENGKLVFDSQSAFTFSAVNIKMIGAVPTGNLLDAVLNIPKNYEGRIMDKILNKLRPDRAIPQDNLNDSTSNPS